MVETRYELFIDRDESMSNSPVLTRRPYHCGRSLELCVEAAKRELKGVRWRIFRVERTEVLSSRKTKK